MTTNTSAYQRPAEIRRSAGEATEPENPLPKDEMFHLLSNRRRRDVLRYLTEHDGPVDMRDIAEQVAAWEHETTVQQLSSQERQRVYIALYQTHLPKLDDHGVIAYNQSRGLIERTERARQLEPYLEGPDVAGDDAARATPGARELALCAVGLAALIVGWTGLVSAFVLLAVTWTALIVAVLVRPRFDLRDLRPD